MPDRGFPRTPDNSGPEYPERSKISKNKAHDRYDYVSIAIAFFAFVAAGSSSAFTYQQTCISRDQEYRTLRPYLVIIPELLAGTFESGSPKIKISFENVGTTPIYHMVSTIGSDINIGVVNASFDAADCRWQYTENTPIGHSFAKAHSITTTPVIDEQHTTRDIGSGPMALFAYGYVCYKDAFTRLHAMRVCYQWDQATPEPQQCPLVAEADLKDEADDLDSPDQCDPLSKLRKFWEWVRVPLVAGAT